MQLICINNDTFTVMAVIFDVFTSLEEYEDVIFINLLVRR